MANKWYKIKIPSLSITLSVKFVKDCNEIVKDVKKYGHAEEDGVDVEGLFFYDQSGNPRILFSLEGMSDRLIVHEVFHATMHILEETGQKFDIENHEIHAWLCDYLFEEVHKKWETWKTVDLAKRAISEERKS